MKSTHFINSVLITVVISVIKFSNGLFLMPEYTGSLVSSEFLYPNHLEQLDIIWRFDHSINLEMEYFELDGQSGDFLLISDLPLTFEESFFEFNGTDELPDFLPQSIITNQGLLLSWSANATIQILSEYGTFIYFHAEKTEGRGTYPFKGFNITVTDLDMMRTPKPSTTTEPTIDTPEPQVLIYISKFLSCNPPQEFLENKDVFKYALAEIATEYCNETQGCKEYLTAPFNYTEVNIPTENGLHYCDPLWSVYEFCVEVTFAITRVEELNGNYLMPRDKLEEMWTRKQGDIIAKGYCPFEPPLPLSQMNSWVWMASLLGFTLILVLLFAMTWLVCSQQDKYHREELSTEEERNAEEDGPPADRRFFDRENPVYSVLAKIKKGNEENKYLEIFHAQPNYDLQTSPNNYKTKVKNNALFEEQEVTFEYENPAFGDDETEIYGHGNNNPDNINDNPNDNQTYGQTFVSIPRSNVDEESDTSI